MIRPSRPSYVPIFTKTALTRTRSLRPKPVGFSRTSTTYPRRRGIEEVRAIDPVHGTPLHDQRHRIHVVDDEGDHVDDPAAKGSGGLPEERIVDMDRLRGRSPAFTSRSLLTRSR